MEYLIGLDIGTTSTKAVAFDLKGNVISKCNIGYPILNPKPSWSEQDPEEMFEAVINSIKYVVDENAEKGNKLLGVSFSSAMYGIIAVDENGYKLDGNDKDAGFDMLFAFDGELFEIDSDFSVLLNGDGIYGIGSGSPFAIGALYAGATVEQALEIAANNDIYTSEPFQIVKQSKIALTKR